MTFCSRPALWVPEVHAPDLLEVAVLSGTRMVKRKAKERFWKYCLTPSLSGVFTGPVTSLGWSPHEIITGISQGTSYNFQSQVLLQFSLDLGSMYIETGLNDANVLSTQASAVFAGIFSSRKMING
jgi:hypothetical protein